MLLWSIIRSKSKKLVFWIDMMRNLNILSRIEYFGIWSYLEKKKKYTKNILHLEKNFLSVQSIKYSFRDVNLIFKKRKTREWKIIKPKLKSYGIIKIRLKIEKKLYDKAEDHLKSVVIFHRYPRLHRKSLRIIIINCSFIVRYQKIYFKN